MQRNCYWGKKTFWKGNIECLLYKWCGISQEKGFECFQGMFPEERLSTGTTSVSWLPQTWLSVLSKQNRQLYEQYGQLEIQQNAEQSFQILLGIKCCYFIKNKPSYISCWTFKSCWLWVIFKFIVIHAANNRSYTWKKHYFKEAIWCFFKSSLFCLSVIE